MYRRFVIVFFLGFSSGLPFSLLTSTLQAWFSSSGQSILQTGFVSLLGLPYLLRFFWGPWVDRYTLFAMGKRRSWIFSMQWALCLGLNAMAWCSPVTSPYLLMMLACTMAFCSSIQDVTIDAHRVEYLAVQEQGLGASLAMTGYRLAMLLAGGVALIVAQYLGFALAYRLMGCMMVVGMIAISRSPEPSLPTTHGFSFFASMTSLFRELGSLKNVFLLCGFVFFYKLGEVFTTISSGIVMPFLIQSMGFSLKTIAYFNTFLGMAALLLGAVVAGWVLIRGSLYRALLWFGCLQAGTNVLFLIMAKHGPHLGLLAAAVCCDNFVAGMASTALIVLFMRIVDRRFTATQFSILVALSTLPRIVSGPLGAFLQMSWGWVGVYECGVLFALGFLPFLYRSRGLIARLEAKTTAF